MIAAGTELGPYTVLDKLGAGGMGDVYLARDNRLGREVALKMLPGPFARDPQRLALFRREALTLAALNHPHIAIIHGFEEPEPGTLFLVLERVEGESLAQRLARGPLAVEEALQVCAKVAEALEVAHERGVIHRDLKPGNVMLGPRGVVKVLDFGLARTAEPRTPGHSSPAPPPETWDGEATLVGASMDDAADDEVVGTPGYMSPEQTRAEPQDARTDVFAFGCLLYECLSGRRAFTGQTLAEVFAATQEREADRSALPAATPSRVLELLDRCLVKDVGGRLPEIRLARTEIEEALGIRRASALRTGEGVAATPNNLPGNATSFVGREQETAECLRRLGQARLLTLTGVGGSGKTRLALQVAARLLPEYPDGIWFVDLAPVTEPDRVVVAMALSLGLRDEPGKTTAQALVEHLGSRRALILLDNCEHLVAASGDLAALLLKTCADVRLLATSREALGVAGEASFAVPALGLPSEAIAADPDALRQFESVRLFLDRASQAKPGFDLTAENGPAVGEICRRLDGIPLAIELAAARVKVLSAEQIRAKLDDRFRLLTGGSRTALPRQQTLRATIQWSYDHLAELERQLLRCLAVFSGGWTLEAATAVWGEDADEFEVLDLITRLVDKSLIVVESTGESARYRYLETVRQYAAEQLDQAGETAVVSDRHLDFFLALGEAAEKELVGSNQKEWFARLDAEHPNLLGALAWCASTPAGSEKGLRLGSALARFWSGRGNYELGRASLDRALRLDAAAAPTSARAGALVRLGGMALYQGDHAAARAPIEESLAIYRTLGDAKGIARSLSGLATVATYQCDYPAARGYGEEVLAGYEAAGDSRGAAVTLHNLACVALYEGAADSAAELFRRSLGLLRDVGDLKHTALTLAGLAEASARMGDLEASAGSLTGSLAIVREIGAKREGAYALEGAAELAFRLNDPDHAIRFLAAARSLREEIGSPLSSAEQQERATFLDKVKARVGEHTFQQEFNLAQAPGFETAVDEAVAWLERSTPDASIGHPPPELDPQ
jgi:non-specific serine/threonine protein kinase